MGSPPEEGTDRQTDVAAAVETAITDAAPAAGAIGFGGGNSTATRTILTGGASLVGGRAAVLVLQVAIGLLLARLLMPSDFGLLGMVMAIVNFALMFRDLGLSYVTVQRNDLTEQQLSNLFWVNLAFGSGITAVLFASSPLIAAYYGVEGIVASVGAVSVAFLLNAAAVQHSALMRRRFRFAQLAVGDLLSVALSGAVAVGLALAGFGIWALLVQQIVRGATYLVYVVAATRWIPSRPKSGEGTGAHLKFGAEVLAFDVVNYIGSNVDKVLLGRYYGPETVGYFTRAQELVLLPISQLRGPLTTAAVPALASAADRPDEYRSGFLVVARLNAYLSTPFLALAALVAPTVVPFVLGRQWTASVPFFQWLALSGIPRTLIGTLGSHLIASGSSRRYLAWGVFQSLTLVVAVVASIRVSALAVAMALAAANAILFLPSAIYVLRGSHVAPWEFIRISLKPVALSAFSALGASGVLALIVASSFAEAALGSAVFATVYCLGAATDGEVRQPVSRMLRQFAGRGR